MTTLTIFKEMSKTVRHEEAILQYCSGLPIVSVILSEKADGGGRDLQVDFSSYVHEFIRLTYLQYFSVKS